MNTILVDESKAVLNEIKLPGITSGLTIFLKRLDLIHPHINGNKWYKLKYNLQKAEEEGYDTILTFGGAFSNHIYSTSAAANMLGFKTIGIIRGEEYSPLNSTLSFAASQGMKLFYKDRKTFRLIHTGEYFDEIRKEFGDAYILPEGGTNELAVKGCAEIPESIRIGYDYLCTPCGTGGTLSGLVTGAPNNVTVLGFPVLKGGEFLNREVNALTKRVSGKRYSNWQIIQDYHFGGYAKVTPDLLKFKKVFESLNTVPLDYIYTSKMLLGIWELANKDYFPSESVVVVLHTGGLQGNAGMEKKIINADGNQE